ILPACFWGKKPQKIEIFRGFVLSLSEGFQTFAMKIPRSKRGYGPIYVYVYLRFFTTKSKKSNKF
ncbi:MAG: hypothetical protein LBK05_05355, partial [Treponema sp.]|nr:hypothetical protein [Treponema sp.]